MKLYLSLLTIFIFSFSVFGQQKPLEPVPRKPTRKIYVQKNDGSSLTGLFVGGDADSITIRVSDQNQIVNLDEIKSVIFTEGIATRIGTDSRLQTTESLDYKGTGILPPEPSDYKGTGRTPTDSADLRTISGGVLNGKAVSLVKPEYPAAARAVRASGVVNVQVTIGGDGSVLSASAVSGHPLLRQAAENAARASKFSPTILQGEPVRITGTVFYNFAP